MKKIKFTGGFFEQDTELKLIDGSDNISLIYGKNGSGKSTVAKAIAKAKGIDVSDIASAKLYDQDDNEILDTSIVHVFNEDYINNRVKICSDGLNAIVLLGELGEIEENIKKVKTEIHKEEENIKKQEEVCAKYKKVDSPESPQYFKMKINMGISGDSHWAEREKVINNGKRNASVNESVIASILATKIVHTEAELKKTFHEKMELLTQVRKNQAVKISNTTQLEISVNILELSDLLKKQLQKPELSEREKYLLALVEQGRSNQLESMKNTFRSEKISFCPFCLQTVDKNYKLNLLHSIELVLSKEVDEHKEKLKKFLRQEIAFDFGQYKVLESDNLVSCEKNLIDINNEIIRINGIIQSKIDNPYLPIEEFGTCLELLIEKYEEARKRLQEEIEQYNSVLSNTQRLVCDLQEINKELARIEVNVLYDSYLKLTDLEQKDELKMSEIRKKLHEAKNKLDYYNNRKKNIDIAVGLINKSLRYVFFSKERLEIRVEKDKYRLYSNGLPVKPNNVSVGERNIIALCYFFTELITNQEIKDGYSKKIILVIDDPVSSFDFENKVGIMSLLKSKFTQIIFDNKESRIVVLTHDMQCMFDLQKIAEKICAEYKVKSNGNKITYKGSELRNKKLIEFNYKSRHEYSELMKLVYDYALGEKDGLENIIGNIMRRVLEAFSTFLYKKGIDEISFDPSILGTIENEECIEYFKNLMYRLVLNGESHMLERTKALEDNEYLEFMSAEAKERTSKEILSFMYLLNKQHVLAHLAEKRGVQENLECWCEEIKMFQQNT
ncbi:MAG: AAA family ATPase [Lachnospiraceae bacterium]|nr:AAA family ATPase [Lachnospiraceae bacterium]